jgi:hypothetical protein
MAITAQLDDGRLLEFPDGTDPLVIQSTVKRLISESMTPAAPAEGIGAAFKGGFKRFGSGLETALESVIDPQKAAERGLERGEKISEQYAPGASLERVKQKYEQDGLFSAAKEAVSQIPGALAEQVPNAGAMFAGGRLGATAGGTIGGPVGALVGGGVGALAAALPGLYASNLERQAQEGKQVERSSALGAAVPGAALEVVSNYIPLGRGFIGKILGPTAEKALARGSNEAIEQAAKESLLGSVTRGVGTGLLSEIPTEVSQQMLERLQAGLPLTTPDALAEYGEAAYGAGLVGGPFGGAARLAGRPGAREQYEKLQQEQAAMEEPAPLALPNNITEMPEGYSVARQEVGKDYIPSFNIMAPGAESPLATVDTEEEAQKRLQRYTEIRQQESEKYTDELDKIDDSVQKMQSKLDYMEATQQTGSEEYQQLKTNFPTYMEDAAQKKSDLMDKIESYSQPLQITPAGQTEQIQEQFTVRDKSGQPLQSFNTMGEAEAYVRDAVGEKPFKAAQERSQDMKALEESLTQTMRGFGLKDVAFKLVDQIERNAAGAYGNKLIRVAMDEKNPLQTMRHESVHALKDLGFFTPQQWKALESRAKSEWVKTYLEGSQTEVDGQRMSRLEGYKKIGLTEDAIIEEAIADAFAAYDKGQTPPPGLIAQLFKQLKQFFARLKQAMNGAGFQTADDIFQSIERGELKPSLKGAAKPSETKYSQAPEGIPQNLWDLHNKSMEADEAASSYNVGSRKATATKASRRLLKAVADYVGDDDQAQIALMVKMNQESNRRNEGYYGTTRFSLNKPSSDVGHKRVANSGRYVGAPDWVGSSPQQLANLRKKLFGLAKEGEAGKYWYENSSKAILELAGGDKKEAEKIVGLIAIYSPNNTVPGNTSMALNAYYQYKTGQKISAGLSDADKKADELLNQNKPWGGIKTNSFYQNLMVSIDPSKLDQGVATMDMWMALAFDYGMKVLDQGPKYKFAEREIQKIAKDLGWDAHQVQAAIWTAMKGRVEPIRTKLKEAELKNGIGENYDKDGKTLFRVKPDRRYDHYRLAHQMGMEHDLKQEDIIASKYDFSDAIEERTAQMSWEATPGESTGVLPGILKAPIQQKFEYLEDVGKVLLDANANDKIAVKIGLPVRKSIVGFSAWNGDIGAGKQTFAGIALEGSKDKRDAKPEARNLLNLYCAIKGYVLNQEAVVWQKPVYDGSIKNQNGIEARFSRGLNFEEMKALYQGLHDKFDTWEIAPGYLDDGFRVLNFTSIPNKEFHKGVQEVLENMPDTFGGGMSNFTAYRSIGDYISNDWNAAKQGEQYAEQIESLAAQVGISNPSDLLKWATSLRTDVEAVNERFSKKYDWGKPTTRSAESAVRPSTGGGEGITLGNKRQEGAVTVTGVHYGNAKTDTLDASKYGSGLRGGERRRLDDAFDTRIKNRVYFYVKKDTGVMPLRESGVGTHAYTQTFNNILGQGPEMSRLYTEAKGDGNEFETKIIDAGYDGYTMPNMGMMVILNHNVPAEYRGTVADLKGEHPEAKYSLKAPTTPEFKKWFDDSKIVNEDGNPLVMYHGTFQKTEEGGMTVPRTRSNRNAFFVSPDANFASKYAMNDLDWHPDKKGFGPVQEGAQIYPVYISAKNPFDYENADHLAKIIPKFKKVLKEQEGFDRSTIEDFVKALGEGKWSSVELANDHDLFELNDFDAFYTKEMGRKNLGVFYPNQIKSATGNLGTYNRGSSDIRYSLKASFPTAAAAEAAAYQKAPPSTPEFKRFFGASKIMDEGRPQVMYHASPEDFNVFRENKPIFVSPDPKEAEYYGKRHRTIDNMKVNVYPLWVRAETPFDYEDRDHVTLVRQKLIDNPLIGEEFATSEERLMSGDWSAIEDESVLKAIAELGFDSFYVKEGKAKNLAVFKANQVKSVTGNIGEFDRDTKDIRYSLSKFEKSDLPKGGGLYTLPKDTLLYHGAYKERADRIEESGGVLLSRPAMKVSGGNFDEGGLIFFGEEETAKNFAESKADPMAVESAREAGIERLPGKVFETATDRPYKLVGRNYKIKAAEAKALNKALGLPDYKSLSAGDPLSLAATRANDFRASNIERYMVEKSNGKQQEMSAPWPVIFRAIGVDGFYDSLGVALTADNGIRLIGKDGKLEKYSLPNLSAAENDAVNRTTTVRESKGYMERIIDAVSPKNYTYFRQASLNRYEALSDADKLLAKMTGSPGLRASQSAEAAAHMSDLHAGVAASVFGIQGRRGGVPVFKNGMTSVDHSKKGLVAILSPLSKFGDPRAYRDFQFYAGVKRGMRLMASGPAGYTEKLFEPADIKLAESIRQKYEAAGIDFEAVRKDWVTFNDAVTDYLVQTGVLSKIDAQKFKKYSDYIPFYRQLEGERTLGPNIFQSLSGVTKPKALGKGGEAPLADFMETIVRNTHAAITAGMKNSAEQKIIDVGKQVGIINEIAPGSSVRAEERVKVLINGVKHEYQCTDQMFADATRSLNMPDLPFISFLSKPADLLRNMITREPGFIMTNLLRDSVSAYVTSGVNITPISGTIINFGKAMKGNSPEFEALMDAGIIGGYEFSANAEQSGERLTADLMKKSGKGSVTKRAFDSVWDGLEKATTASDAATRMAVYERVLAETGDEVEALYRSLEVMNFNRKGSSAVVRILTAAVPFLNARMQGLDVFYRAITGKMNNADAKEIQARFFRRGMMIMGLSTMYYFAVAGNPDYEKQEQETKDNNWLIPGSNVRIPIPFEVGILFKTIPERIAAYTFGNDTGKDFLDAMKRAGNGFIPVSPAAYIPQTFKPIIEAMTNYSFFTQREIVGMGLKDVAPEFQVGPGTSAFAEFVGKTLGLSPIKVDYVFKGYTGTMGMYAVDMMDMVMDINSDSPKPTKRFEQLPIIKRLVLDPEARGNVTNYYQLKDSVDTTVRTMNLLEKSGKPEEFAEYVRENAGTLAMRSYVNDLEKSMKQLREMKGAVRNSTMSGDQKRDTLTAIGQAENNLTTNIQTVKQVIEKAKP